MANPSTEGGSGAGTEVLRRGYIDGLSDTEATLLTGVANHIYTVLSVIFCERDASTTEKIHMYVDADLAGSDIYLLRHQAIGADATFIWNDKFVITETDKLHVKAVTAANFDVWISYIDQDWT